METQYLRIHIAFNYISYFAKRMQNDNKKNLFMGIEHTII